MAGRIIACATYVPFLRLTRAEYRKAWGRCAADISEKAVADYDEDAVTMAVEAGRQVLALVDAAGVRVLALASTTLPYAEKMAAGTVAAALGLPEKVTSVELGTSARAGTEALLSALALLGGEEGTALVLAADCPAAGPGEDLDHALGAAACAFVLAAGSGGVEFEGAASRVTERLGERFVPRGAVRIRDVGVRTYTGEAYAATVGAVVRDLLERLGRRPGDYRYVVLPQFDGRQTASLGRRLGFTSEQMEAGLIFARVGDTGVCASLLGFCAVLEQASPGDRILVAGYGSGCGGQALSFVVREPVLRPPHGLHYWLERKRYIDYLHYLKLRLKEQLL